MAGSGLDGVAFELSAIVEQHYPGAGILHNGGSRNRTRGLGGKSSSEKRVGDVAWLSMISSRYGTVVRREARHG